MFTGLVEEIGRVEHISLTGTAPLRISCQTVLEGTRVGDSIAVNGVCLTVSGLGSRSFVADLQPVTRHLSNLGALRIGDGVNLERSLGSSARFGGHYVQGHIDGTAAIVSVVEDGPSKLVRLALPNELMPYVVERGFIAVDGASLTVMRSRPDGIDVSLVEHTQHAITLPRKSPGERVNIEVDVIAKYVERLLHRSPEPEPVISMDFLHRHGFG